MKLIIALTLLASFSASAGVELYRKELNNVCTLKDNKLTRTIAVHYGQASVTTTQNAVVSGLDELAKKAHSLSTGRTMMEGYEMKVIVDGDEATLHSNDSMEAMSLMTLMSKLCN